MRSHLCESRSEELASTYVWHLFVLAGSACHVVAVTQYIIK